MAKSTLSVLCARWLAVLAAQRIEVSPPVGQPTIISQLILGHFQRRPKIIWRLRLMLSIDQILETQQKALSGIENLQPLAVDSMTYMLQKVCRSDPASKSLMYDEVGSSGEDSQQQDRHES